MTKHSTSLGLVGALALAALSTTALAAPAPAYKIPTGPGSLSGVWSPADIDRSVFRDPVRNRTLTVEGEPVPLMPWAKDIIEKRAEGDKQGKPFAGLQSKCLPAGMPQMMFGSGLPHQTMEAPNYVVILVEELSFFRIIRLDQKPEEDPDPTLMGHSVGHWEGNTLVVETNGISDRTQIPGAGPHSDQLKITERFTRTSKDRIEHLVTYNDPIAFSKPWTVANHLQLDPGKRITEYYCENNRNVEVDGVTTVVHPG